MLMTWLKMSTVVSTPVHPACQPCPAAASYWPASACPSSSAAELLSEEATVQPEMMGARLERRPRRVAPLLDSSCVWLASQSGAWLGRLGGRKAWMGEGREEEGGRRCLILPVASPLLLCPLHPLRVSPVLSGTLEERDLDKNSRSKQILLIRITLWPIY